MFLLIDYGSGAIKHVKRDLGRLIIIIEFQVAHKLSSWENCAKDDVIRVGSNQFKLSLGVYFGLPSFIYARYISFIGSYFLRNWFLLLALVIVS